ncbi:MAG: hypothetical protein E6J40_10405, partial [Chloroflexi bacterium]
MDLAEETGDKIDLYRVQSITEPAREMGEYLAKAGIEIAAAVKTLQGFAQLQPHRVEIHKLENEGDRMLRVAIGELFSGARDASELL